jgi:hypothetical protein
MVERVKKQNEKLKIIKSSSGDKKKKNKIEKRK